MLVLWSLACADKSNDSVPCVPSDWAADTDQDGHGDPEGVVSACDAPAGHVAAADDCDDGESGTHPGAAEICDGVDQDCDGVADQDLPVTTLYVDVDGDGHGDPNTAETGCDPAGDVPVGDDCDDADPDTWPGAPEPDCTDPVDHDCDGVVAWADGDGDGSAACVDCDDAENRGIDARSPAHSSWASIQADRAACHDASQSSSSSQVVPT